MRVTVKPTGRMRGEPRVVELETSLGDRWDVTYEGESIGVVARGTYRYSPPAAGFHGRIARYHRQVKCWRSSLHGLGSLARHYETRNAALADLIAEHEGAS